MQTYSMDLRQRIVAACDEGMETRRDRRAVLGQRVLDPPATPTPARERLNRPEAARRGQPPAFDGEAAERLRRAVAADPDATLKELGQSQPGRLQHLGRGPALRRLGITPQKKSLRAAEQDRPDVRVQRRRLAQAVRGHGCQHVTYQ